MGEIRLTCEEGYLYVDSYANLPEGIEAYINDRSAFDSDLDIIKLNEEPVKEAIDNGIEIFYVVIKNPRIVTEEGGWSHWGRVFPETYLVYDSLQVEYIEEDK